MAIYRADQFAANHFFSEGLQLPLGFDNESHGMSNVTTLFDCEFSDMNKPDGITPMLIQDSYQQPSFVVSEAHSINNSSTSVTELEMLPLYIASQNSLYCSSIHSTSKVNKTKNSKSCCHCQKSKVKCDYLENIPCKRCITRGLKCIFHPQQRRGPKPGKKIMSNMSNLAAFRRLNHDYTQKAHKLGFNVHRIVACPNNSGTTLPVEKNFIMVSPEFMVHPSPQLILSSSDCETEKSPKSIWDDNYHNNNETEIDPTLTSLYLNSH
ncbi:15941_t:CDS:1 [Gigaspora margarita]|uniref:15941_t:CDS:1 n=1 Tax=Gigaspora margarita TaxID=4874 RepID=A0ABN7VML2_GIGMA|nr:15941_t:CDS:1 [Gigaspora margarita]